MMSRSLRILHVSNFNYGMYGARFNASVAIKVSNGFTRNGHLVVPFSHRDVARFETPLRSKRWGVGKMNRRLLEACANVEPDLICMGHSELVTAETLREIRDRHPRTKTCLWFHDPLWATDKLGHLHARAPYLDGIFVSTGGEHMKPFKTPHNRVGVFPPPVDGSIERHRNFAEADLPIDLLFCGRANTDASERAVFLSQARDRLRDIRFDINGMFGAPLVFGAAYDKKLRASRMALNMNRRDDQFMYSSARLWQLAGNGLLVLSQSGPGLERLFGADEVAYFDGLDDLVETVRRFHADDAARRRVAEAGWRRAHGSYNVERVCRYMIETVMGEPHSEPYEWADQLI